jgi:hypothetical protein
VMCINENFPFLSCAAACISGSSKLTFVVDDRLLSIILSVSSDQPLFVVVKDDA